MNRFSLGTNYGRVQRQRLNNTLQMQESTKIKILKNI
jgi:hypothetical protein